MSYFAKELENQPVFVFGHPMRFDFLATEDPALISELNKCAAKGVGGVISITKEHYDEELKKKAEATFQNGSKLHPSLPHRQEILSPNLPDRRAVDQRDQRHQAAERRRDCRDPRHHGLGVEARALGT